MSLSINHLNAKISNEEINWQWVTEMITICNLLMISTLVNRNFTRDTLAINHWNYLENCLPKIPWKSPKGLWVKAHLCYSLWCGLHDFRLMYCCMLSSYTVCVHVSNCSLFCSSSTWCTVVQGAIKESDFQDLEINLVSPAGMGVGGLTASLCF